MQRSSPIRVNARLLPLGTLGLLAAATPPTSSQEAAPPGDPSERALYEYVVETERSSLVVVTHKGGLLSFLGHDHAIVPTSWSADLCLGDPVPTAAHGNIRIETASLVIDSDSARALAGLGGGPGADDVRRIQRTLLDADHLAAADHPSITLEIDSTERPDADTLIAWARLTIRGHTQPVAIPVEAEATTPGTIRLSGTFRIRQSDFGLDPESIAGVVEVADEVDLRFDLVAEATARACEPRPSPAP